jgi:integrase
VGQTEYLRRRLESVTADELAALVRDMRNEGKGEATIAAVLGAAGRIHKFAARRLGFSGVNPTTLMLPSERPKVSLAKRLPIFTPEQIERTIAAATEPYRTLFTVAALTGARISELFGLMWADRSPRRRRRRRDHVRLSGRPSRQPPADQDRRLRKNGSDPWRARARPRPPQAFSR